MNEMQKRQDLTVDPAALELINEALSTNTRTAYKRQWKAYEAWCINEQRTSLPSTPHSLATYVAHLASMSKSKSTINQALAAIEHRHRTHGHEPDTRAAHRALKGYRTAPPRRQAPALSPAELRMVVGTMDVSTAQGRRDRALILLGYSLMARVSELVALDTGDLRFVPEGVEVAVRRSKTDQAGDGARVVVHHGSGVTDPVSAVREHLAGSGQGPVFKGMRRSDRLSVRSAQDAIKAAFTAAGVEGSAHSLRSGGATAAAMAGARRADIAARGRWNPTSTAIDAYIRAADQRTTDVFGGVL